MFPKLGDLCLKQDYSLQAVSVISPAPKAQMLWTKAAPATCLFSKLVLLAHPGFIPFSAPHDSAWWPWAGRGSFAHAPW